MTDVAAYAAAAAAAAEPAEAVVTHSFRNSTPGGYVPIKPQYIVKLGAARTDAADASSSAPPADDKTNTGAQQRERQAQDRGGDAAATNTKTRGMFTGAERANATAGAVASERPTFEGESNFLNSDGIKKAKVILKKKDEFLRTQQSVCQAASNEIARAAIAAGAAKRHANEIAYAEAAAAAVSSSADTSASAAGGVVPAVCEAGERRERDDDGNNAAPKAEEREAEAQPTTSSCADPQNQQQPAQTSTTTEKGAVDHTTTSRLHVSEVARCRALDDEPVEAKRKRMFENKLVLAPLTTVGNLPYRRICKEFGVDVTFSEVAMCYNMNQLQKSEWALARRHESEKIFGIQLAAKNGGEAALTASLLETFDYDYDFVDINCGCPVDLFVKRGCGCGLWEKKNKMRDVVQSLYAFQSKPVTVKCRVGPDENDPQLHKHIGQYESWGASAVTVHGRSRKQRYTKSANWDYIERVSHLTRLPVIGNGDVMGWEDVVERREYCPNVNSYMVGRGALIKPWLFTEIKEERVWDISSSERFDMLKKFCSHGLNHWGADEKGVATTRRFLCEWQSFLCRYVPVGLLERGPQRINDRPPIYVGRDDLETLMASENVADWIKISEMLLGPSGDKFNFTPKHKSNSYAVPSLDSTIAGAAAQAAAAMGGGGKQASGAAGGDDDDSDMTDEG